MKEVQKTRIMEKNEGDYTKESGVEKKMREDKRRFGETKEKHIEAGTMSERHRQ